MLSDINAADADMSRREKEGKVNQVLGKTAKPRILLIGAGRFGKIHLKILKKLHQQGELTLVGAVVRSEKSQKEISRTYKIPVYTKVDASLLNQVDAVYIVTPYKTHFSLVKKCLRYADVLVEKPLAANSRQAWKLAEYAKKQKRVLMVGHVYRFHPVINWLKRFLAGKKTMPQLVEGKLVNPIGGPIVDDIKLEFLHFFDIGDYLWEKLPIISSEVKRDQLTTVHLHTLEA